MPQFRKLWTEEKEEQVIHLYNQHSVLWDTQDPDHVKRKKKHLALMIIATKLGPEFTAQIVQSKIKSFRDYFIKELKKERQSKNSSCGSVTQYTSKWSYYERLQFLRDCTRPDSSRSSDDLSLPPFEFSHCDLEPNQAEDVAESVHGKIKEEFDEVSLPTDQVECNIGNSSEQNESFAATFAPAADSGSVPEVEKEWTQQENLEESIELKKIELMSKAVTALSAEVVDEDDEDDIFFRYVAKRMKRMTSETKEELRHIINTFIYEHRGAEHNVQ